MKNKNSIFDWLFSSMDELIVCDYLDEMEDNKQRWRSGCTRHMVKCNNPNCPVPDKGYPTGRDLKEVITEWKKVNKQYDEWIGALDIAIKALEKQIPKKPIKSSKQDVRYTTKYDCPNCGKKFVGTGVAKYCNHCGQVLDWSEE